VEVVNGLHDLTTDEIENDIIPKINVGNPVPLCLVRAKTSDLINNPKEFFTKNHQVLAIGYEKHNVAGEEHWDIHIYDPNYPKEVNTLHHHSHYHVQTKKSNNSKFEKVRYQVATFRGFFDSKTSQKVPTWILSE
jgi:hypothetical protein